jgi:uncharacterized membrane protein
LTHFFNAPLLTRALLATVGALPWLIAAFGLNSPAVHGIFHGLCHQRPERSLFIFGSQMAVCSRCAGIYAGLLVGALTPPIGFMARHGRIVVWTAFSVAAFDVAATYFSLYPLNHAVRLATGFFAGWAACSYLFSCLKNEGARQNGYGEN